MGIWDFSDFWDTGPHEPDPILQPRSFVIGIESLAMRSHIHVENGCGQTVLRMLIGDDGLFNRIRAAYRRAIVVAAIRIAGTNALDKRNPLGFLLIRQPGKMAAERTRCGEHTLELDTCHDIPVSAVSVFALLLCVECIITW